MYDEIVWTLLWAGSMFISRRFMGGTLHSYAFTGIEGVRDWWKWFERNGTERQVMRYYPEG